MGIISEEIIKSANEINIRIYMLENNACNDIFNSVSEIYEKPDNNSGFIWDGLISAAYLHDPQGWLKTGDFIEENPCLLLISDGYERKAFRFLNGSDLVKLLNNTFAFEFYITDEQYSYLICFNHHDCLIGCGNALTWIESLNK